MKIPAKQVVRNYELTYLMPVSYSEAELKKLRETVAEIISKHGGSVENTEEWGLKDLAYSIVHKHKAQSQAHYVHVVFSAKPESIQAIDAELKLNDTVMRFMLIVADDVAAEEKTATTEEK